LSNALADDLLKDLNLTSDDYNNGTTIQLVCFLAAEFPVQFLTKRYGFKWVLPTMMVGWSTVSWAQAWMHDRTSFYLGRAFIGLFEGGFIPGVILFSTYFYKSKELAVRLAVFWSTLNVARVVSALLAAGILEMRGIQGKPGWFWLFLLEGLLTFIIGVLSYLYLPTSPTSTKSVLWPKGYYTEREEVIMVNVSVCQHNLQLARLTRNSAFSATTQPKASLRSKNLPASGTFGRRGRIPPCGACTSLASSRTSRHRPFKATSR
jgi:MFS family permease